MSLTPMSLAVVLFAKAPVAGRVKTRLIPPFSADQAAGFHHACVWDVWEKLENLAADRYFYSDVPWDTAPAPATPGQVRLQRGADLGERMLNCFLELQDQGHGGVLILGSDSPTLPAAFIREGLEALSKAGSVLGPSEDGGYYAIGCREPHPGMFAGVPWSSPETLRRTEENLRALGHGIHKLPPWYDVDTANDFSRLAAEASPPLHVARWIAAHRSLFT